jgi:hypothetical protein
MSEEELLFLAKHIVSNMPPAIPLYAQSCDLAFIANYYKISEPYAKRTITCLPDFPKGSPRHLKGKVYNMQEFLDWVEKHKDKH